MRRIVWGALVLLACAEAKPAPQPKEALEPVVTSASDAFEERAEALMHALQSGDMAQIESFFDAKMRAALPPEKLTALLQDMKSKVGAFRSWTPLLSGQISGFQTRDLDVAFEKTHLVAHVVISPDTHEVVGLFFKALPAPYKPAPVDPAAPFRAEEVKVGQAPFILGGTLTIPKTTGQHPAIVLVAGSGPHDRDETISANKPFRDLAEGLSAKGVVVLRYDKRTFSYGHRMDAMKTTVDEEVILDAVAGVSLLRARPEVDPNRIYVLGHSLGALLAPEIALRAAPVAGVVMLAPTSRPLPEVVVDQLRLLGAPADKVNEVAVMARRLLAGQMKPDEDFFGAPAHYWMDLMGRDEIAAATKIGVPIFILRGDRDFQVAEADIDGWRRGLATTANVTIETLPGLNHLFIRGEGKPNPQEYDQPGHVDQRVIDKLAAFIR